MSTENEHLVERIQAAFTPGVRIVFWEDKDSDFTAFANSAELPGIKLLALDGNELTAKRQVLRTDKDSRYLLYRAYHREPFDDLLYDVKLAAKPFSCKQVAIYAEECGIDLSLQQTIENNTRFFANKDRRAALAATQLPKETPEELSFALLAAIFNIKAGTRNDVMREIIARLIIRRTKRDFSYERLLEETGLLNDFWHNTKQVTGYDSQTPSIEDLGCELLAASCAAAMKDPPQLTADADIILAKLSTAGEFEDFISSTGPAIQNDLRDDLDVQALEQLDYLAVFDQKLLTSALEKLKHGTLKAAQAVELQAKRSDKYWFKKFKPYYATLSQAAILSERLAAFERELPSATAIKDFVQRYAGSWAQIDRAYRLLNVSYSELPPDSKFKNHIEGTKNLLLRKYDRYLEDLATAWQAAIASAGVWPPAGVLAQEKFYSLVVSAAAPHDADGERVAVIVSDGLRYELATELKSMLTCKRWDKKLKITLRPMLSTLPSYTQLGMAALLPHSVLEINPDDLNVSVDGRPSNGTSNRAALLQSTEPRSAAIGIGQEPAKETLRNSSIVYAYFNTVDKTGDEKTTEHKVFSAAEEAFKEIERLTETLLANGYKEVIVTADHGFIYQTGNLDLYDFIDIESLPKTKAALGGKNTRRFIVAPAIPENEYLMEFDAKSLSLEGDYSVAVPRGIRRIRVKGSGAAYVHGGATLQETVIPVLSIKRDTRAATEARPSDAQLFDSGRGIVTGSGITATLYQTEPIGESVIASQVEIAAFSADGKLLSNEVSIALASLSNDADSRKTKFTVTLTSEADDYEKIELKVRRRRGDTNRYETLITQMYTMRRAMGMDF